MIEFKAWPKIPRYSNERWIITEKIDGTNACIIIDTEDNVAAQSRTRLITPFDDNFGFAGWVEDNKHELLLLGPGHHYGEWWGSGIQRGYDCTQKRFSLFSWWLDEIPECCERVPLFTNGTSIMDALEQLMTDGSKAAPGFMRPEGLVITSTHYNNAKYKVIID